MRQNPLYIRQYKLSTLKQAPLFYLNGIKEEPPKGFPPNPPKGLSAGIPPIDIGDPKPPPMGDSGENGDIGLRPGMPPKPIGDMGDIEDMGEV